MSDRLSRLLRGADLTISDFTEKTISRLLAIALVKLSAMFPLNSKYRLRSALWFDGKANLIEQIGLLIFHLSGIALIFIVGFGKIGETLFEDKMGLGLLFSGSLFFDMAVILVLSTMVEFVGTVKYAVLKRKEIAFSSLLMILAIGVAVVLEMNAEFKHFQTITEIFQFRIIHLLFLLWGIGYAIFVCGTYYEFFHIDANDSDLNVVPLPIIEVDKSAEKIEKNLVYERICENIDKEGLSPERAEKKKFELALFFLNPWLPSNRLLRIVWCSIVVVGIYGFSAKQSPYYWLLPLAPWFSPKFFWGCVLLGYTISGQDLKNLMRYLKSPDD